MFEALEKKIQALGDRVLEGHSQTIKELIETHVAPQIRAIAGDDTKLRSILAEAYRFLPPMVKPLVSEDQFCAFVMSHKDLLLRGATKI